MGNRIGDIQTVKNANRKPRANSVYFHVRVQLEDGKEIPLLFTALEMRRAAERATKNPEDVPKVSKIRNFFD